ncbi:MAG: type II toxin-antitoxin system Phd/YefM family antitoxin [Trueperaceae bacterium]|nr:MAG: type II toxin-antitoxin system Phd/YefM family antitoxin [Trueperaceae bacterium]
MYNIMEVNISTFRRDLRHYLKLVERGEDVVILRDGKPVARLTPPQDPGRIDFEALATFREKLGVTLEQNPVVAARRDERH